MSSFSNNIITFLLFTILGVFLVSAVPAQVSPGFKINTFKMADYDSILSATTSRQLPGYDELDSTSAWNMQIVYNSLILQVKSLKNRRDSCRDSIDEYRLSNPHDVKGIFSRMVQCDKIVHEIDSLERQIERLGSLANYKKWNWFNFTTRRSRGIFDVLYHRDSGNSKLQVLNDAGFTLGDQTGSVYAELVNGKLGWFRVGFGTMIAKSYSDTLNTLSDDEAYRRLSTSGGNTVLNMECPLLYVHSLNNQYNGVVRLMIRGVADFQEFGTETDTWAGNLSCALDFYGDAALDNNKLRGFASFNIGGYWGNKQYIDNLGLNARTFVWGQASLGLVLANTVQFALAIKSISNQSELRNGSIFLSTKILFE